MRHQKDDSPLYLFETRMDEDQRIGQLLSDFEIPDYFPHDLFDLVPKAQKQPYRWFCIEPKRSGTTVHTDPLGTAAWNAVTHGRKRWVVFEPNTPRRVAKAKDVIDKEREDDEPVMYFDFLLPRLKQKYPQLRSYEGIQGPGEVIFIPGNWWHGVVNLEDCVAVTQNYCGLDNFDEVWRRTRKEREKLAYRWLRNMRRFAPELHRRAIQPNMEAKFQMRHERGEGDETPTQSSSSGSSSDSSTDEGEDPDVKWGGAR